LDSGIPSNNEDECGQGEGENACPQQTCPPPAKNDDSRHSDKQAGRLFGQPSEDKAGAPNRNLQNVAF
jgi:hypothetical protein